MSVSKSEIRMAIRMSDVTLPLDLRGLPYEKRAMIEINNNSTRIVLDMLQRILEEGVADD